MKNSALSVVLFLAASAVQAQTAGVVTLRANATSATGSMVPVLTWSTSPVATSCSASGGWSGTKAASGSQTLATITANTNYTLTCNWNSGSARVSWTAPTTNTNGSALANLAAYRVYYGTSASSLSQSAEVNDITQRAATINSLTPGTWFFAVRAVNTSQLESDNSGVWNKSVAGATAASTVGITITPTTPPPATPGRRVIATPAYDLVRGTNGRFVLGRVVGTVAIGKPCRTYYLTGDYYGVQTGYVKLTTTMRGDTLVARCALP
jgi:hypothetical protein